MPKVTLVHPNLPGQSITVGERSAKIHEAAGWQPEGLLLDEADVPAEGDESENPTEF